MVRFYAKTRTLDSSNNVSRRSCRSAGVEFEDGVAEAGLSESTVRNRVSDKIYPTKADRGDKARCDSAPQADMSLGLRGRASHGAVISSLSLDREAQQQRCPRYWTW